MKLIKYNGILLGFSFLIVIILLISFIALSTLNKSKNFSNQTYAVSFSERLTAEQIKADLLALHNAMSDVILSRNEEQIRVDVENANKYDEKVNKHFKALSDLGNNALIDDIIKTYNDWTPMRSATLEYIKNGQFDLAAENNKTISAYQLNITLEKIELFINNKTEEMQQAFELSETTYEQTTSLLVLLTMCSIVLAVIVTLLTRNKLYAYVKELQKEKEELKITFESIGDGIITTDINKNIMKLNRVAQKMTGWSSVEAFGMPFSQVFNISNSEDLEKTNDPVDDFFDTNQICKLEPHKMLTSKNGTKRLITVSVTPINNANGETTGTVLIFRDVTENIQIQKQLCISESHYRMLFNSMLNGYALHEMLFDKNGFPYDYKFVDLNPAFEEMTGLKKTNCIGKSIRELLPKTEDFWISTYGKVTITGEPIRLENFSEAIQKHFEVYAFRPIKNHFAVLISDITQRKKLESTIFKEKEQLKITFDSIGDGVITTDISENVQRLNKVAEELTGWNSEDAIGKPFNEVFNISNELSGKKAKNPVETVLTTDKIIELENHTILTSKNGTKRHIADSAAPIKDSEGNTIGVVMVFRDVTEKKLDMDRIKFLSYHDSLTGLYNRAYFDSQLDKIDVESNLPLSIIMGDVNGLKLSNDVYGHEAGDLLLISIANILKKICDKNSIIARYGGDEFVILLPNCSNERAEVICENIKSACDKSDIRPIILSISLGASTKVDRKSDFKTILNNAEDKMYNHKLVEGKSVRSTIISSLQKTLFEKSCETEEHAERMMQLATQLSQEIHLTQYEMEEMKLLTLLHDVGKIGISNDILNKPGKLTNDEWQEMKKHPEIGYRIAQSTSELAHISELILTHHEHWDGSGYPQGLNGEQIPKLSRVLAIIDTFDVMTHKRAYKNPVSKSEALEEIKRCSGTQFDPNLVNIFIKTILKNKLEDN